MNKPNIKSLIIVTAFVMVLIYSAFTWYCAMRWEHTVQSNETEWYQQPELSRMEIKNTYDLAFEKIVLVSGFVFVGLGLCIKNGSK